MAPDGDRVWVLDTSALIRFKELISVSGQWAAFKHLEELVRSGSIAMPRQVIAEAAEISHPDLPGAWAPGVRRELKHPLVPDDEFIMNVMETAGDVVDPQSESDEADPWVCALALQLARDGFTPIVVTEDTIDRQPIKVSILTACARLGIATCSARIFPDACGIKTLREAAFESGNEEDA